MFEGFQCLANNKSKISVSKYHEAAVILRRLFGSDQLDLAVTGAQSSHVPTAAGNSDNPKYLK